MKKISKISRIKKIENNLRQQENEIKKSKNKKTSDFDIILKEEQKVEDKQYEKKKISSLDAYKFEVQKSIIAQKKITQMNNEENEHNEKG